MIDLKYDSRFKKDCRLTSRIDLKNDSSTKKQDSNPLSWTQTFVTEYSSNWKKGKSYLIDI